MFLTACICEYTHNYWHCIIDLTQRGWHTLRLLLTIQIRYGPTNDNGIWRTSYNIELYVLYDELAIAKSDRNKDWDGWDTFRKQELDPCRKLTLLKPAEVVYSVEEDLKNMGVRNWRRKSQDREHWRTILEQAKVQQGL